MSLAGPGAPVDGRPAVDRTAIAAFYGDDFTGATDALGQFARLGLRGMLLVHATDVLRWRDACGAYDVVGIAGVSRAMATTEMDGEVRTALEFLRDLRPAVVQYKVCSTFDSSPGRGSIGRAIEIARDVFGPQCTPVAPAQPEFDRFTVFGTHFAVDGDRVHRLDRHPTMSRHPSTPMREADLTRVLGEQTTLSTGLLDVRQLAAVRRGTATVEEIWVAAAETHDVVVVDALTDDDLRLAAEVALETADPGKGPRFVVGSGGLSLGLARQLTGREPAPVAEGSGAAQTLVLSGSRSPRTARQVAAAVGQGWRLLALDPAELVPGRRRGDALLRLVEDLCRELGSGADVIVHVSDVPAHGGDHAGADLAAGIGQAFGELLDAVLRRRPVGRVVVTGGDTSGFTVRALDAYGLEIQDQVAPAGWLCRLLSSAPHLNGLRIVLKGGQVGGDDFFQVVREGRPRSGAPASAVQGSTGPPGAAQVLPRPDRAPSVPAPG